MPYTADKPGRTPAAEELMARIPGWGVDLDPADRPNVPREIFAPGSTGAHWELPEQQPGSEGRERSVEHARITPAFGTTLPLRGLSGALRRKAYASFSEGRAAHWLILLAADRVDVIENDLRDLARGRVSNPVATGLRSEVTHGGVRSRLGTTRVDTHHQWMDPLVTVGPLALGAVGAVVVARRLLSRR